MAWTLIKEGGEAENFGRAHKEFMIDSISDIDTEPTQYGTIAPGSFAYTGGYDTIFQKDVNGQWIEVSNGDGPHTLAWDNITGKPTVFPPDGNNLVAGGAVTVSTATTSDHNPPSLNIAQGGSTVTGYASANIGNGNAVSGGGSLAVGTGLTVSGQASLAVGGGSKATGSYCFAAGSGAQANAQGAVAFGGSSQANASTSLAAGGSAVANGVCSIALGGSAVANGVCSAAIGSGVIASGDSQIAVGTSNVEDEDGEYAVIVGNGSNGSRSNALTVDWNGNVESAGNLTIHYDGEEIDVGEAITSGGGGGATVKVVKFTLADNEEGVYTTVSCDATCEEIIAAVNDDNTIVKAIASIDSLNGIAVRAEIDMCGTYYNMKAVIASIPESDISTFGKTIYLRGLDDEWMDVTE